MTEITNDETKIKKDILKVIRETLVIENKQSIYIAVDKIYNLIQTKNDK